MTHKEEKFATEDDLLRWLARFAHEHLHNHGNFCPSEIRVVDAGGTHAITAVIADSDVYLTVAVVIEDDEPKTFQFFTTESIKALRDSCDRILARGALDEDDKS